MRLIDADAFIDEVNVGVKGFEAVLSRLKTDEPVGYFHRPSVIATIKLYEIIKEYIERQPTVERLRGEWISGFADDKEVTLCSNCGSIIPTRYELGYLAKEYNRYCYWCGADMRGEE